MRNLVKIQLLFRIISIHILNNKLTLNYYKQVVNELSPLKYFITRNRNNKTLTAIESKSEIRSPKQT